MTASFQLLTSFVPHAAIMPVMLLGEILCGAFPGRNYGIHGLRDNPRLPLRARPGRVARRGNEFSSAEMVFPGRQGRQLVEVQLLLAFKDSVCVLCVYCRSAVNDGIIFHQYVST